MVRSNREILTGGKKYSTNKAKKHAVEEVVFDKSSREVFDRIPQKKARETEKAQIFHKEQERLARIEERKKAKLERQKELVEQMEKYKKNLKELAGDFSVSESDDDGEEDENQDEKDEEEIPEEWNGFSDDDEDKPKGILKKREIYGEDGTEVTIEDISTNGLEEIAKLNYVNLKKSQKVLEESIERAKKYAVIASGEKKKPKKKFRYLTKTERRDNNRKAITNKRRSYKKD